MLTDNFTPKNSYTHLVTKKSMGIISQCPHHKKCYAPFCPLDIYQDQVRPLFYMKEFHKCKFQKRRRKEIAKDYKELKYDGLNPDEWEKIKAWRNTPKDKKISISKNLNKKSKKT